MEHHVQQEARVWSRVMASGQQSRESAPACPTAESLMELIRQELTNACTYRYLASRVCCPGDREILACLARDEQEHAKQLSAAYFVLTGKKACPGKPEHPCVTCVAETLRQQYFGELEGAKRYDTMATGQFAETFQCLSMQEAQHAQKLLCVMGNL